MVKKYEFRDPVHSFIEVDAGERRVIDTRPVQRLRYIRQLANSHLVYPGATHTRFEHSLGTMEMAGRMYDAVTDPLRDNGYLYKALPMLKNDTYRRYCRRIVRMAGLCHDLGHLPFSHAAEHELLPKGWNHERLSYELIRSEEMTEALWAMMPPVRSEDVARIAVGQQPWLDRVLTPWERIQSDIIGGNAFGADRMDYLLRDSLHAGVAYGRFDHHRLIGTLRILPMAFANDYGEDEPGLGVEWGGLPSAEALLMARYFMFVQVYFHKIRMIYDRHLIDFLTEYLPDGRFSTDLEEHLAMTDDEINVGIRRAARKATATGHQWARRLAARNHFRVVYARRRRDVELRHDAPQVVEQMLINEYGRDAVRSARGRDDGAPVRFPVLTESGDVELSVDVSGLLNRFPIIASDYIYVDEAILKDAEEWLKENKDAMLGQDTQGGSENGTD